MATTLETTVRAFLAFIDECDDYMDTGDVLDYAAQLRAALPDPAPAAGLADAADVARYGAWRAAQDRAHRAGEHDATPDPDCGPCTAELLAEPAPVDVVADVNARDHAAGRHELLARAGCPDSSCRARIARALLADPAARCADSYGPARACEERPEMVLAYTGAPGAGVSGTVQTFCADHGRRTLARFAHCYRNDTPDSSADVRQA